MIVWISLALSLAAAAITTLVATEVLAAMVPKRAGVRMWAAWMSVAACGMLVLLHQLATLRPPPLPVSVLLMVLSWELYGIRKRLIWRAYNGGRP